MNQELTKIRLESLEAVIDEARHTFRESASALYEIRENKLWKLNPEYKDLNFADYCSTRFPWARDYAYKMAKAGEVIKSLPEDVSTLVETESKAREVAKVKPEKRARVVREAAAKAEEEGKPMAARHIAEAAREDEPEHERPHVVIHEEALGSLKAGRVLKSFDAWLSMNFPDAEERKWAVGLIRDHVEDLISQSGAMR
jgi:hypothetical protein